MAAYHRVDFLKSPAGWLPVHQDQLRAQHSTTSLNVLITYLIIYICVRCVQIRSRQRRWAIHVFSISTRHTSTSSVWTCGTHRVHWVKIVSISTSGFLIHNLPPPLLTAPSHRKPSWYYCKEIVDSILCPSVILAGLNRWTKFGRNRDRYSCRGLSLLRDMTRYRVIMWKHDVIHKTGNT